MSRDSSTPQEDLHRIITALQHASCFDHPVSQFITVETHISIVLLTGDYAYKFKKPVDLGFVDFTSLDKRRHYCEEELRLNRRLAADLYLAVIAIGGETDAPLLNTTPAIEYCVQMHQFPRTAELDRVLSERALPAAAFRELAHTVARFHEQAQTATVDSGYGATELVRRYCLANFDDIDPGLRGADDRADLMTLREWSETEIKRVSDTIERRRQTGRVRECHGDMHLSNMIWLDNRIQVFDCIEFNAELRWIDVMNEIAFLLMDLDSRDRSDLGRVFLNAYLEAGGDYAGLPLLRLFQVYRSMVRGKIAALRVGQEQGSDRQKARRIFRRHIRLARRYIDNHAVPVLIITHGLSGSGKTTITEGLTPATGAIRIRSDIERKRLAGLTATEASHSDIDQGLYDPSHTERTYERLCECARSVIQAGLPAIVDAAFLETARRKRFQELAEELSVPFRILDCRAPVEVLRERIMQRSQEGYDASEADSQVLDHQLQTLEALSETEQQHVVRIDTTTAVNCQFLIRRLGITPAS